MQTIHKINNHVVNKMKTTFTEIISDNNVKKIIPTYFLSENVPVQKSSFIKIKHDFKYECTSCHKPTKKIYSGFCYLCLIKKPEADMCIMSPNRCHYLKGTCRSPEFGEMFCYQPHYLYLAFTDKYKIGLTRHTQIPTRWIDQGATLVSPFMKTHSRHQAGIIEKFLTQKWADKSQWQNMLKMGNGHPSLEEFNEQLMLLKDWVLNHESWQSSELHVDIPSHLNMEKEIEFLPTEIVQIVYPWADESPSTIQSLKLEKSPCIESPILGIKGQYIMLDNGSVINIRNHSGFVADIECIE